KHVALLLGLDTFRGRRHVARGGNVHDGLDDRGRRAGSGKILDEGAVDLDLVERKALQIAQRRIAGAEIVERDAHAELAQLMQDIECGIVVADQHGLGDLELEPRGRESRRRQRGGDVERQRLALELDRRHVDRNMDMIRPVHGFPARGVEHPVPEIVDQAGILGDRDEVRGRDGPALG
ncbi:hypothetical protein chiPu_0033275, partial [Chiloscyllium punctatum]|nr:hypothetical protein [Chiloscyllium punctatum]